MTSAPNVPPTNPRKLPLSAFSPKVRTGGFFFLCLAIALVSIPKFIPSVAMAMPHTAVHFEARPLTFVVHVIAAGLALAALPFQATRSIRARRPVLHRWMGRAYVVACLFGAVSGLGLALGGASATANLGFALLAVLWFATTALGWRAARARDFAAHRVWMIRSGALTLAAVTLRLYLPFGVMGGMEINEIYTIVAWACWVPNLVAAEWLIVPQVRRAAA